MLIKKIRVKNFKSFKDLDLDLGNFNVLIGANASGKSNFIQIFQFLRDIINFGLDNAISMQGGIEYLRNISMGDSEDLLINIICDHQYGFIGKNTEKDQIGVKPYKINYEFVLKFHKTGFTIIKDRLAQKCKFVMLEEDDKQNTLIETKEIGEGEIVVSCKNGKIDVDLNIPEHITIENHVNPSSFLEEDSTNTLLIQKTFFFINFLHKLFNRIAIYDFDPKLPKKGTPLTGKLQLEEDASNLSIVLRNILANEDKKRKLFNLVNDLLPFIDDLDVEKFVDNSLIFKVKEKYFKENYIPSSLISDGTINITAILIALYFENKLLTIIEEPERNIHPHLMSKIVSMMRDACEKKQVIVTTHNPEIVRYAGLENILLVSRDKHGFSTISRPADNQEVKTFLNNEIGIEELYVQNMLEHN